MAKLEDTTTVDAPVLETKGRLPRKKVYERINHSELPEDLVAHFKKDNYDLKSVRWASQGDVDYGYLNRREREGYEFVTEQEIPRNLLKGLLTISTKTHAGLLTMGDLCLMKVDCDLRNSRRRYYQANTDKEVAAVDNNLKDKTKFRNFGTSSKVIFKEPSFQE
jgi:hypothetical protein